MSAEWPRAFERYEELAVNQPACGSAMWQMREYAIATERVGELKLRWETKAAGVDGRSYRLLLALFAELENDFVAARVHFTKAIELAPDDSVAWRLRGQMESAQRMPDARATLEKAAKLESIEGSAGEAAEALAEEHLMSNRSDEARVVLDRAVLGARDPERWLQLTEKRAEAALAQGRLKELIAQLKNAPAGPVGGSEIAQAYFTAQDYAQASAELAQARQERPGDPLLRRQALAIARAAGRSSEVARLLREETKLAPTPELWRELFAILLANENVEEVRLVLKEQGSTLFAEPRAWREQLPKFWQLDLTRPAAEALEKVARGGSWEATIMRAELLIMEKEWAAAEEALWNMFDAKFDAEPLAAGDLAWVAGRPLFVPVAAIPGAHYSQRASRLGDTPPLFSPGLFTARDRLVHETIHDARDRTILYLAVIAAETQRAPTFVTQLAKHIADWPRAERLFAWAVVQNVPGLLQEMEGYTKETRNPALDVFCRRQLTNIQRQSLSPDLQARVSALTVSFPGNDWTAALARGLALRFEEAARSLREGALNEAWRKFEEAASGASNGGIRATDFERVSGSSTLAFALPQTISSRRVEATALVLRTLYPRSPRFRWPTPKEASDALFGPTEPAVQSTTAGNGPSPATAQVSDSEAGRFFSPPPALYSSRQADQLRTIFRQTKMGDTSQAVWPRLKRELDAQVAELPRDEAFFARLTSAYFAWGYEEHAEAIARMEGLLADTRDPSVCLGLATMLLKRGDRAGAEKLLEGIIAPTPVSDRFVKSWRLRLAAEAGDIAKATTLASEIADAAWETSDLGLILAALEKGGCTEAATILRPRVLAEAMREENTLDQPAALRTLQSSDARGKAIELARQILSQTPTSGRSPSLNLARDSAVQTIKSLGELERYQAQLLQESSAAPEDAELLQRIAEGLHGAKAATAWGRLLNMRPNQHVAARRILRPDMAMETEEERILFEKLLALDPDEVVQVRSDLYFHSYQAAGHLPRLAEAISTAPFRLMNERRGLPPGANPWLERARGFVDARQPQAAVQVIRKGLATMRQDPTDLRRMLIEQLIALNRREEVAREIVDFVAPATPTLPFIFAWSGPGSAYMPARSTDLGLWKLARSAEFTPEMRARVKAAATQDATARAIVTSLEVADRERAELAGNEATAADWPPEFVAYEQVAMSEPEIGFAFRQLIAFATGNGRREALAQRWRRAGAEENGWPFCRLLGWLELEDGQASTAAAQFQLAINEGAAGAAEWEGFGKALLGNPARRAEAEAALARAIEIAGRDGGGTSAVIALANSHLANGQAAEALAVLEHGLETVRDAEGWRRVAQRWAEAAFDFGRLPEEILKLEAAIQSGDAHAAARLAQCYVAAGDLALASHTLASARKAQPANVLLRRELLVVEDLAQNWTVTAELLREEAEVNPTPSTWRKLFFTLVENGERDDAVALLAKHGASIAASPATWRESIRRLWQLDLARPMADLVEKDVASTGWEGLLTLAELRIVEGDLAGAEAPLWQVLAAPANGPALSSLGQEDAKRNAVARGWPSFPEADYFMWRSYFEQYRPQQGQPNLPVIFAPEMHTGFPAQPPQRTLQDARDRALLCLALIADREDRAPVFLERLRTNMKAYSIREQVFAWTLIESPTNLILEIEAMPQEAHTAKLDEICAASLQTMAAYGLIDDETKAAAKRMAASLGRRKTVQEASVRQQRPDDGRTGLALAMEKIRKAPQAEVPLSAWRPPYPAAARFAKSLRLKRAAAAGDPGAALALTQEILAGPWEFEDMRGFVQAMGASQNTEALALWRHRWAPEVKSERNSSRLGLALSELAQGSEDATAVAIAKTILRLRSAIRVSESEAGIRTAACSVLARLGERDAYVAALGEKTKAAPASLEWQARLAEIAENPDRAWQKVLELQPNHRRALHAILRSQQPKGAAQREVFERLLALEPDETLARYTDQLFTSYKAADQLPRLAAQISGAPFHRGRRWRAFGDTSGPWKQLAESLVGARQGEAAVLILHKARSVLDPFPPVLRDTLVQQLIALNRETEAGNIFVELLVPQAAAYPALFVVKDIFTLNDASPALTVDALKMAYRLGLAAELRARLEKADQNLERKAALAFLRVRARDPGVLAKLSGLSAELVGTKRIDWFNTENNVTRWGMPLAKELTGWPEAMTEYRQFLATVHGSLESGGPSWRRFEIAQLVLQSGDRETALKYARNARTAAQRSRDDVEQLHGWRETYDFAMDAHDEGLANECAAEILKRANLDRDSLGWGLSFAESALRGGRISDAESMLAILRDRSLTKKFDSRYSEGVRLAACEARLQIVQGNLPAIVPVCWLDPDHTTPEQATIVWDVGVKSTLSKNESTPAVLGVPLPQLDGKVDVELFFGADTESMVLASLPAMGGRGVWRGALPAPSGLARVMLTHAGVTHFGTAMPIFSGKNLLAKNGSGTFWGFSADHAREVPDGPGASISHVSFQVENYSLPSDQATLVGRRIELRPGCDYFLSGWVRGGRNRVNLGWRTYDRAEKALSVGSIAGYTSGKELWHFQHQHLRRRGLGVEGEVLPTEAVWLEPLVKEGRLGFDLAGFSLIEIRPASEPVSINAWAVAPTAKNSAATICWEISPRLKPRLNDPSRSEIAVAGEDFPVFDGFYEIELFHGATPSAMRKLAKVPAAKARGTWTSPVPLGGGYVLAVARGKTNVLFSLASSVPAEPNLLTNPQLQLKADAQLARPDNLEIPGWPELRADAVVAHRGGPRPGGEYVSIRVAHRSDRQTTTSRRIPLASGKDYLLTGWLRTSPGSGFARLTGRFYDKDGKPLDQINTPPIEAGRWVQVQQSLRQTGISAGSEQVIPAQAVDFELIIEATAGCEVDGLYFGELIRAPGGER
jgi:hypothetical protein